MTSTMKAAVKLKSAPGSTEVRKVSIPEPTPSEVLIRVDNADIPLGLAKMQDPLGNGVFTVTNANVPGKTIAIFGLGPIGLLAVALCRGIAARSVTAIGLKNQYRMALAKKMGPSVVLRP